MKRGLSVCFIIVVLVVFGNFAVLQWRTGDDPHHLLGGVCRRIHGQGIQGPGQKEIWDRR